VKAQWVRAVDVLALGPFMVWAGARPSSLPEWARAVLVLSGVGTVVYNGANFVKVRRETVRIRELMRP